MQALEHLDGRRWGALFAVGVAVLASAGTGIGSISAEGQSPGPDAGVEVLTVGEIDRIDEEERSFRIRTLRTEPEDPAEAPRRPVQVGPISISVGAQTTRNNVSLGAGAGSPAPDSPRPEPGTSRLPQAAPTPDPEALNYITTRVFTSPETRIHQDEAEISFEALAPGDRVTVRGIPQGNDVQAVDITRQAPDPDRN